MPEIDNPNHFYLGRDHDLATGETNLDKPLLYKSGQLTTHAVCVGMTGSGKTGLCLSLLEEAALDGVPAICIDPKGDLGNLLLGFPKLAPEDFEPWVDPAVADRKGITPAELAKETAELWKKGLASWDETPERVQRYNDTVERLIFTPGASHGIPMTVLKSFDAPPQALLEDTDAFRSRVQSAVSGLLALLGIDADPVRSREHILLSNILTTAWNAGKDLSIAEMIREIQKPPFATVGVMDLDDFYPQKERSKLAMDLNNLLASPSFAGWMSGQALDVQQLLYSPEGKPRHSIVSIAHLDDAQRMFFVTILLNEILAWTRTQAGTSSLRALVYMDEVYGYFPPSKKPPSKEPMLTLLKQARAFGVGVVLATQNPVDLDYKGLSNTGAWFLGRLQTERDKMRVMEGLEGASAQAGSVFNKQRMEQTLAALGNRVFLLNNVHEDEPRVFQTRWAMSYLAGPLSRGQIKKLMDPVRDKFVSEKQKVENPAPVEPASETVSEEAKKEPEADVSTNKTDARKVSPNRPESQKARELRAKLTKRENDLCQAIITLPFAWVSPALKGWELYEAKRQKRGTARKTDAVESEISSALSQMFRPITLHAEWRNTRAMLNAALPVSANKSVPWLSPKIAGALAILVVELLCIAIVLFLLAKYGSQLLSPTIQEATSNLQTEPPNGIQLSPTDQAR